MFRELDNRSSGRNRKDAGGNWPDLPDHFEGDIMHGISVLIRSPNKFHLADESGLPHCKTKKGKIVDKKTFYLIGDSACKKCKCPHGVNG